MFTLMPHLGYKVSEQEQNFYVGSLMLKLAWKLETEWVMDGKPMKSK